MRSNKKPYPNVLKKPLETRQNAAGYQSYKDSNGKWIYTHRRVAEKKLGRKIGSDEQVHHINHCTSDNRPRNLVSLKTKIHKELHRAEKVGYDVCFRCGRRSHYSYECFAKTDFELYKLDKEKEKEKEDELYEYTYEYEMVYEESGYESQFPSGSCSRCGRTSHIASSCNARTDMYGNKL